MSKKSIGIYIHIPFCSKKCKYCDFVSFDNEFQRENIYIDKLIEEINSIKKDIYNVETIFIGGGTPSVLTVENIKKLGIALNEFSFDRDIEFSVECNPCSINREKFIAFKSIGVNRISFGLQSYDNELLKIIGRIHDVETFENKYREARNIGFKNINVDIIFNLPSQNINSFRKTLEKVVELNPEHISAYGLIIEEDTPFYNMVENGEIEMPNEDLDREMYELCEDFLAEKGYYKYEISNYSKNGFACRHNIKYWKREDYIGFGLNAHSLLNNKRFNNTSKFDVYINEDFKESYETNRDVELLSQKDEIEETIFLGLRLTDGISVYNFEKRFKLSLYDLYSEVIEKFKKDGLVEFDNERLKLTKKGVSLSNYVLSEFLL